MSKKFPGLNLIKFIAAVGIVCHHYFLVTGWKRLEFFESGGILVELFFMISGFLMMNSYQAVKESCFKYFFLKKLSRFYPLTAITILVMATTEWVHFLLYNTWITVSADFWNVLTSLFLGPWGGLSNSTELRINNPTWYLSVLCCCYVIFFIIVKIADKINKSVVYGFLAMTALGCNMMYFSNTYVPYYNPTIGRGYAAFFAGCILYIVIEKLNHQVSYVAVMGIILFIVPMLGNGKAELYYDWHYSVMYILFPLIITLVSKNRWITRICDNAVVAAIGGGHLRFIYGILLL